MLVFMGKQNKWSSILVKIKNEETSITIDLAIWWSRFIGQISVVLITVFKKEEKGGGRNRA